MISSVLQIRPLRPLTGKTYLCQGQRAQPQRFPCHSREERHLVDTWREGTRLCVRVPRADVGQLSSSPPPPLPTTLWRNFVGVLFNSDITHAHTHTHTHTHSYTPNQTHKPLSVCLSVSHTNTHTCTQTGKQNTHTHNTHVHDTHVHTHTHTHTHTHCIGLCVPQTTQLVFVFLSLGIKTDKQYGH